MSKQPIPASTGGAVGTYPTITKLVGHIGTESLPSAITPPNLPLF